MAYMKDPKGRPCVTITEAARLKHVTKEAIRQAIRRGVIRNVTMIHARLHLVPLASLERYEPDPKRSPGVALSA